MAQSSVNDIAVLKAVSTSFLATGDLTNRFRQKVNAYSLGDASKIIYQSQINKIFACKRPSLKCEIPRNRKITAAPFIAVHDNRLIKAILTFRSKF